jgi:hypothetical protein
MILTEIETAQIPEVYRRFAGVVGDSHWKKRVALLRQETKGKRFLAGYIQQENPIAFQLEHLRELATRFGTIPSWEINNRAFYPAASFAAQVLSIIDASPKGLADQFKRQIHGAFKNPDDMRGLRLELSIATHFARRGLKIGWPEMNGLGTFDLFVEDVGPHGLEVECKSISSDKGRKVHRREALSFYSLLWPHLEFTKRGLRTGLSVVLTVPGRLPKDYKACMELAKQVGTHIFRGQSATLNDGVTIRINEFDAGRLSNIPSAKNPQEVRIAIDGVTETKNRETMVIGTHAGGALALIVQSAEDDTFMKAVFDTLSNSAKQQFTGNRGGMFLTGLHGIDGGQLRSIADQDQDPLKPPTALRLGVSKFLSGTDRDHVIGVGFVSESVLSPVEDGLLESGGTAYYFPKRESPYWSDQFSGLFSWSESRSGSRSSFGKYFDVADTRLL